MEQGDKKKYAGLKRKLFGTSVIACLDSRQSQDSGRTVTKKPPLADRPKLTFTSIFYQVKISNIILLSLWTRLPTAPNFERTLPTTKGISNNLILFNSLHKSCP